ncbi:hypothetical protein HFX73_002603, partial [Enterococcus faecium]|nr:hypothetical protein [Enterococcus faecium]
IPDTALKGEINRRLNSEKIDGKTDRAATDPVYDLELAQLKRIGYRGSAVDSKITNLEGLQYATNLTSLELWKCSNVEDLSPIKGLKNLDYLGVAYTKVKDLSQIKDCTSLTEIDSATGSLESIKGVENLVNLKKLSIPANHIKDFSPLKKIIDNLTTFNANNQTLTAEKQEVTGNQAVVKPIEMILPNGTKLYHAAEISDNGQFHMDNIVIPWDSDQEKNVTYRLISGGAGTMASISATVTQPVKFIHTTESLVITPYKLAGDTIQGTASAGVEEVQCVITDGEGNEQTYTNGTLTEIPNKEEKNVTFPVAAGSINSDTKKVEIKALKNGKVVANYNVALINRAQVDHYHYGDKYITGAQNTGINGFKYTVESQDGTKKSYFASVKEMSGSYQVYVAPGVISANTKSVTLYGLKDNRVVTREEVSFGVDENSQLGLNDYTYGDKYITCTAGSNITSFKYTVEQANGTTKTYNSAGVKEGNTWKIYAAPGVITPNTKVVVYGLNKGAVADQKELVVKTAANSQIKVDSYNYGDKYITGIAGSDITGFKYTIEKPDGTVNSYNISAEALTGNQFKLYVASNRITPEVKSVKVYGLKNNQVVSEQEVTCSVKENCQMSVEQYNIGDKYIMGQAESGITSFKYTVEALDGTIKTYVTQGIVEDGQFKLYVAPNVITSETKQVVVYGLNNGIAVNQHVLKF